MKKPGSESTNDASESGDLADGIVGNADYSFTVPAKKQFLPWHKPRKQFIRHEQWAHHIGKMIDEINDGSPITYFGLPGVDLLDLRYFGSAVCAPRSLKLRFLGFNDAADPLSGDQAELNISLDELSKSDLIDPKSMIIPDDFRQLVNEESIAWQKTFEFSPYDVVNLDLCDGFGAKAAGGLNETYYNAVSKLLAVQARKKTPWLMLLTTRVGKEHIHADTLNRLSALYANNLDKCPGFKEASAKWFKINSGQSLHNAKLRNFGLQKVFLVGICKWFLQFAVGQNPPSKMEVKAIHGYRVVKDSEMEDMVSIAIRFDPLHGPIEDPIKLAGAEPAKIDECDLATAALKRVSNLLDVDEYLSSASDVRDEMVEAMCVLLDAARYDADEYRQWAKT